MVRSHSTPQRPRLTPIARKPLPLTTVELQKAGSRLLRMTPKKVLDVGIRLVASPLKLIPHTGSRTSLPEGFRLLSSYGDRPIRSSVRPHVSYRQTNRRSSMG